MDKYQNDFWTLADGLGIARSGDHVAQMALQVPPPFTIGVIGKWGSGKTSILRRAFATLGGHPISHAVPLAEDHTEFDPDAWNQWRHNYNPERLDGKAWHGLHEIADSGFCVWYSPWLHQSADNPMIPLLLEIQTQFNTWLKLKKRLSNANRRGGMATLALLEKVIDIGAGLTGLNTTPATGTVEHVSKAWRDAAPQAPGLNEGQRFHLLFEDAASNLLGSISPKGHPDARLVIFIDDLDRCEESVIVTLLESIKLYLSTKRCVFVLGIDDGAVLKALRNHWSQRSEDDNREYLEKLFQAHVPIPMPRTDRIQDFVKTQLALHDLPLTAYTPPAAGQSPQLPGECTIDDNLTVLLEPNPRKIKNFLNSLCAAWNLFRDAAPAEDSTEYRRFVHQFVLFHYARLYHKPVWRLLERQPWALKILTAVLTNAPKLPAPLPEGQKPEECPACLPRGIHPDDQRLLAQMFSEAFAHVLKHTPALNEDQPRHRNLELSKAVELFNERLDRKRSDEYFVYWYKSVVNENDELPMALLYLSESGFTGC